jgi:hypothetical protein
VSQLDRLVHMFWPAFRKRSQEVALLKACFGYPMPLTSQGLRLTFPAMGTLQASRGLGRVNLLFLRTVSLPQMGVPTATGVPSCSTPPCQPDVGVSTNFVSA